MKDFIVIDITGLVTFICAANAQQAVMLATELGFKPFIVRQS